MSAGLWGAGAFTAEAQTLPSQLPPLCFSSRFQGNLTQTAASQKASWYSALASQQQLGLHQSKTQPCLAFKAPPHIPQSGTMPSHS